MTTPSTGKKKGSSPQSVGAFGVLAPSPQRTALRADARFSRGSALPAASPLPLPATHTCGILAFEFAAIRRGYGVNLSPYSARHWDDRQSRFAPTNSGEEA